MSNLSNKEKFEKRFNSKFTYDEVAVFFPKINQVLEHIDYLDLLAREIPDSKRDIDANLFQLDLFKHELQAELVNSEKSKRNKEIYLELIRIFALYELEIKQRAKIDFSKPIQQKTEEKPRKHLIKKAGSKDDKSKKLVAIFKMLTDEGIIETKSPNKFLKDLILNNFEIEGINENTLQRYLEEKSVRKYKGSLQEIF